MQYVAVFDIGKTNAKLAIVNVSAREEVEVLTTQNNVVDAYPYPHFDIEKLWDFLNAGLAQLSINFNISSISITTHGACVVLLDETGQLATPVLDYEYRGPAQLTAEYLKIKPGFHETGSPALPDGLNVGAQLHWLFHRDTQLHSHVKTILMYPQYWAYRLSGIAANEPTSLGCHTDLWNPEEGCYSNLVDTLKVRHKMADVQLPSKQLGTILPQIAQSTGLAKSTAVFCGIHDSNASLYTHLADRDPPFSVVSTGTWVICMSPGSDSGSLDETRDTLLNVSATGKPTPSSRFMGGREYDYLVTKYSATQTDQVLQIVAESKSFILPSVESSSGPYQHSRYQWTTDPQKLSGEERYNVISFYLALMTASCLRLCGAKGEIIVEGPFAGNQPYCAMLCAAANSAILVANGNSTGTSIGAALLTQTRPEKSAANAYRKLAVPDSVRHLRTYGQSWRQRTEIHCQHPKPG